MKQAGRLWLGYSATGLHLVSGLFRHLHNPPCDPLKSVSTLGKIARQRTKSRYLMLSQKRSQHHMNPVPRGAACLKLKSDQLRSPVAVVLSTTEAFRLYCK